MSTDDQSVHPHFRSEKVQALLVYLALEAGRPHRRRMLATLLWPDYSEAGSLSNLRKALYYLRETLNEVSAEITPHLLIVDRQTVYLNPDHLVLDAGQFTQLLTEVEQHSHPQLQNCPDCIAKLVAAEHLYRGDLLPGLSLAYAPAFEEWLLFKREQLQQQAILVLQQLTAIFEQQNNFDQAEKYATRLIMLDPYHEQAVRHLMSILTKTDRRNTAVQLYNDLATRLQSEIGVEPEERTRRLVRRIEDDDFLEPAQTVQDMHHLPAQFTPFLGRKDELAQISRLLLDDNCHLLTIIGPGGIGKTRLAIESATKAAESGQFPDGIFFVNLSDVANGDDLPVALATTLLMLPRPNVPSMKQVLDFLKAKRCLLILDNFEHLTGHEQIVADLLAAEPGLTLLITSRQPLYLRAEQQVRIGGLDYPDQQLDETLLTDITQMQAYGAIRLFLQAARLVQPDFATSLANLQAIVHICRLTKGVPLALEIAAAWVRLMDVHHIVDTLLHSLDFFTSPMQDLPDRHRSMRAVFDYSWRLLSLSEQLTLAKAAVFREPFALATAVTVLETRISDIAMLLDKSLLQSPASGHYILHELLRQYSLEKLQNMDHGPQIETAVRHRHSKHYMQLLTQLAPEFHGPEPQVAATIVRHQLGNVTQAWGWAVAHADDPKQLALIADSVDGLGRFYEFLGLASEGERLIRGAIEKITSLAISNEGQTAVAAVISHLLTWQAHFQNRLGEADAATQTAQRALVEGIPTPEAAARAKSLLGELLPNLGQFDEAERLQQESLSYYKETGNTPAEALALGRLGTMQWRRGRYQQAETALKEAIALQKALANKGALATLSSSIAGLYYEQDHVALAQDYVEQARNLFTEVGNEIGVAQTDGYLALLYLKQGQYDLALTHNQQELTVYRRIGDCNFASTAIGNRGSIFSKTGAFDEALACYEEAIQLTNELGLSWHMALHQTHVATIWHEKGDDAQALALLAKAGPLLLEHGAKFYAVSPLLVEGEILLANGRFSAAQTQLNEALELAEQLNLKEYIFEARTLHARLDFVRGEVEQAQRTTLKLLADTEDKAEQARLHYELWRMDASDEHAQLAFELYNELYQKIPQYTFKRHLDELQSQVTPIAKTIN